MKIKITLAAIALAFAVSGNAFANSDDMKWVGKCIMDNADEKQDSKVVQKYCECMNSKMDDNESQSISQWEKTHKAEEEECSKKAGWVGK